LLNLILFQPDDSSALLKQSLAARLGREILAGRLKPGERIVEGKWAREWAVAQTSIREAINILISQGFVQKGHGRSARVIKLSAQEVVQIYVVVGSLESTAARLMVEQKADLTPLRAALQRIRDALATLDLGLFIEAVLEFHITICEVSGNRYLLETYKRLAIPLYAFTLIRGVAVGLGPEPWLNSMPVFERILDAVASGDPFFAERYVSSAIHRFARQAVDFWARFPVAAGQKASNLSAQAIG
jgi:DNA-binding GntR family transcriptional regulator